MAFLSPSEGVAGEATRFFDAACTPGLRGPTPVAPELTSLLLEVGLLGRTSPAGAVQVSDLTAERHGVYVAARNAARKEAHRRMLEERRARLADLLSRLAPLAGQPAAVSQQAGPPPTVDEVRPLVQAFVAAHGESLGAHPLLKGIRALLERQSGDVKVWQWQVQEEVFLEAGDADFMNGAVELLGRAFRRTDGVGPLDDWEIVGEGGVADCERGGANPGTVAWELVPQASDYHIRGLLSLLPRQASLEGRPTGELVCTSRRRTNMRGELDQDAGLCLHSLFRCDIL